MSLRQLPEFLVRRAYFAVPSLVEWYQRRKVATLRSRSQQTQLDGAALLRVLEHVPAGRDIMLHSSLAGLGANASPMHVLDLMRAFCATDRTLLLPSHPVLESGAQGVLRYDPQRSPTWVGLVPELARRSAGFHRSLHPVSSVLARGPWAERYLADNLNADKPLPHGADSPYARLAQRGGYALCLGIAFHKCLSMIHVAEELLDEDFPLRLLFEEIDVDVVVDGTAYRHTVRRRSMKMAPYTSMWSVRRDLVAAGAVRRFDVDGVLLDIVDCEQVVSYMLDRARRDGYPYMFLPRKPRQR